MNVSDIAKLDMELGDEAKDPTTGIQGMIVAVDKWKNGCIRIGIQPKAKKGDSEAPKVHWADSEDVVIVRSVKPKKKTRSAGGPMQDPSHERR